MRGRVAAGAVVALVSLAGAGTAAATITRSTITVTSPTGTYLIDDEVTPNETITGTGTSDGTGGSVDINCYHGDTVSHLVTSVPVQSDGSFSFNTGSLASIDRETCVLRAVNSGDTTDYPPGSTSSFSGPTLAIGEVYNTTVSGGPNNGALESYYLYASQLKGGFDYDSLGDCSISDSYIYDPVTYARTSLDDCNAWFYWENGSGSGFNTPTRSELQVDGADAYSAGNFRSHNPFSGADQLAEFPGLTYSYSIDPSTGNLALTETDQIVKCNPGGFPASPGNCTRVVPTGVQVKLRITQYGDGRIASVVQYFSSSDGRAHSVDLLEDNEFDAPTDDQELNFPWTGTGLQPYTTIGQTIPGPSASGPGSFFIKGSASVPDGGEAAGQGAATFSNPPSGETVIGPTDANHYSWLDLHYTRTVPASGSVALGFTYSNAFLASEVSADAAAAQAAFVPSVTVSGPASNRQSSVTVSGTASDANGVSSVTVDGHSAAVASNGTYTATVPLSPGTNTITAVATNAFGNTAQQTTSAIEAPAVSKVRQSHRRWREQGNSPVGTKFSFHVSEAAKVKFAFTQPGPGRRVHGKCVAPSRHNAHKRACTRTVTVGTASIRGRAGKNTFKFKGRAHGHELKPGTYTVVITATADGVSSKPVKLTFTILT